MLHAGVVEPSVSVWASPSVLVRKRDYRALNVVTTKDVYPLPLISECIDTLADITWFSKLDANSAYWEVTIAEEDRHKTAFLTKYGLYQNRKLAFGLCNGPATYALVMELVLRGLSWDIVLSFLCDAIVNGADVDGHLGNLCRVFERFRKYCLKLKPPKCLFFLQQMSFWRTTSEQKWVGSRSGG